MNEWIQEPPSAKSMREAQRKNVNRQTADRRRDLRQRDLERVADKIQDFGATDGWEAIAEIVKARIAEDEERRLMLLAKFLSDVSLSSDALHELRRMATVAQARIQALTDVLSIPENFREDESKNVETDE